MLARVEERAGRGLLPLWQRIQADWEDRDAGSMPLFGISVSVGIPVFFYNIEYLFVNTKTLRTLTVGEDSF